MLPDDAPAVDGDDQTVRESFPDKSECFGVEVNLVIGGAEDRPVNHQEIGIGGGEAHAVGVKDGARHRELEQPVGLTLQRTEGLQLFFHPLEVLILTVIRIVAAHI